MKKIVAINSSKRKENTYNLLIKIKEKLLKEEMEVEIINLFDYNISECRGCFNCIAKDKCHIKDDTEIIINKLLSCDGIILSSPVYMSSITGKLKVFIDRTSKWFHRPELVKIPILMVATTASSGLKDTIKLMKKTIIAWGAIPAGSITRNIKNINNEVKDDEIENFKKLLNSSSKKYKPTMDVLINYQIQRALANKLFPLDKIYWKEKNYNGDYYFNCKVNIFKKIISKTFYNSFSKKVKLANNSQYEEENKMLSQNRIYS